ncbi:MAG: copper(I)-binding protein [Rickettsiaceae bacterium]|jgi:copper(I)-binding protein|nr:copper(I)-binding protein [Rickettsiaceae bacterium]
MLKKIALTLALSSITLTGSFANNTTDNIKDKARELKDKAAEKVSEMAGTKVSAVEILAPWARPSTSTTSAIYMNLNNPTTKDVALTHVTALDVANKVAVHQTATDSTGLVKMVDIDKVVIPAGKNVELRPNGIHIMLMGLKRVLNVGDKFKVTLKFDDGSSRVVDVEVKNQVM